MREYNTKNKEVVNERNRQHYKKIREDPEKYKKHLEKKREAWRLKKLKNKNTTDVAESAEEINE
jgi:hypothetical protein